MFRRLTARFHEAFQSMDLLVLVAALMLAGMGLLMVLSASGIMAEKLYGTKYHFFERHLLFLAMGIMLMLFTSIVPLDKVIRLKYVILGAVVLALIVTRFTPLGVEVNGAKRWLRIAGFTLQPMEFAKVALVIYLAWFMSKKQNLVQTFTVGVVPPFAVSGLLCGLVLLQPDFGGSVVLAMLLMAMCLVGGTRFIYIFFSLMAGVGASYMLIMQSPYRLKRMLAFLDPFADPLNTGYQLVQSLYAFGSGQLLGTGLGAGKQKLFFLPEAHNDFIMAVVGEELGFMGVSLVFILMGLLIWRAFTIALAQEDLEKRLMAYGVTLIIALGATLNMAVVLGAAPPKGVPMPFLSYGGSNLMASFICIGFLLNISQSSGSSFRAIRSRH